MIALRQGLACYYLRCLSGTVSLAALLAGAPAVAQGAAPAASPAEPAAERIGVGDIVVTAQRRGENLQSVPIAVTALTGEAMRDQGINSLQSVVEATPTLYQASYTVSSSTLFLFMRGMGLGDPIQITKDGSVGFYENGIFNPRPQSIIFDLGDVERVEVLRGPQGTLYGRNTTGGAVNIISRAPSGEFGLRQLASYASRNQYRSITNIDFPEFANIAIKGTIALGGDDGYGENPDDPDVPNTQDFNKEQHVAGRIAARWQPTANFTADYSFQLGRVTTTPILLVAPGLNGIEVVPGIPYQAEKYRAYRPVPLYDSKTRIRDHGLSLEWQATDDLTLRSLTGFRHHRSFNYQDTLEAYFIQLATTHIIHSDQFSQELQAFGSVGDMLTYTAGLYYYRDKSEHFQRLDFGPGGTSVYDVRARSISMAAYAQATITPPILEERFDVTVGGRLTRDKRRASRDQFFSGIELERDISNNQRFTRFNPALTLSYRWSEDVNSYAKVATGYRAGGSSETSPDFTQTYGPEELTSFEIGLKSELFDRRLRANVAAFYNKYKDIQLDLTADPDNPTITRTLNAGRANLKGVEVELSAVPMRDLRLDFSYAFLDTKITRVTAPGSPINLAGLFRIPYAPRHSINAAAVVTVARFDRAELTVRGDYSYKSAVWNTAGAGPDVPGNRFYRTPGYSTVNGRISLATEWGDHPANIALFVQNLLDNDKPVITTAVGAQSTGFILSNLAYAEPRVVGVELQFAF